MKIDLILLVLSGNEQWLLSLAPKTMQMQQRSYSTSRLKVRASSAANLKAGEIPHQWYNLVADLPVKPPPALHPKSLEPIKPEDLSPLFPDELIMQEGSNERFIDIPAEVVDIYRLWRPTPLIRSVLWGTRCIWLFRIILCVGSYL